MKVKLSNCKKRELRKKFYSLKPTVMVGQRGLSEAAIIELNTVLETNRLIKVCFSSKDKSGREKC